MDRYLKPALLEDLGEKILLLTGPRQCGKTTLSKMLTENNQYLSYDLAGRHFLHKLGNLACHLREAKRGSPK